jgi:penicillin-binding protein 1A
LRLRRRTEAPRLRRRIRKLRLLALLLVLFVLAGVAFSFGLVTAVGTEIPQLDPSARRVHDLDGVILGRGKNGTRVLSILNGDESRVLVTADQISPLLKQAIVAVEDKRFYAHNGVDIHGIGRAILEDIRARAVVEGGSTITQQFVKNAYVRNEQTVGRKLREAAFAWQLERKWSKERILTAYLNTIYFGNGAYGIQRAAQTYFGIGAARLDLAQAALLAGLPADPSLYDPVRHPAAARARRLFVLEKLLEQGKISGDELTAAHRTPLPRPDDIRPPGRTGPAQHFVNYVKDQLVATYGADRVFGGGLEVTTTIDLDLQEIARKAIEKILPEAEGPSAALVAIEPSTGAVRVMFGGTSFRKSQFNLASQAERQPGSSFKPIVLASAFRQGIAPETSFTSKPVDIQAGDRVWHVTNYENSYLGRADLRTALITSDNAVYAQLTKVVGPANIVSTAHALGIRAELPAFFSIGLGGVAVSPLDMTRAYATLANDGRRVDGTITGDRPLVIEKVRFRRNGRVVVNEPRLTEALPNEQARLLTSILQEVVERGTGRRAELPGRPAAGKTGTTDNYGDAWFVGYTPTLVAAVWVGYQNELKPMLTEFGGRPVTGSTLPALIWKEFMTAALQRLQARAEGFVPPAFLGAVHQRVAFRGGWKLDNGHCSNAQTIAYFGGASPSTTATCYADEVPVPRVVGLSQPAAEETLSLVPLSTAIVLVPAAPGTRPGVVEKQEPLAGGYLAPNSPVRLFVTKARFGLIPNLVGSNATAARSLLAEQGLRARIRRATGPPGTVLRQSPEPGIAAAPRQRVTMVVGHVRAKATR